jgi:ABC-2 type transport system ATP-binding protein
MTGLAPQPPALEARHIGVSYGARRALSDVSLEIAPGTVYALLGRNGAGKSTFIRCLLGQQLPQVGSARLFGLDSWSERGAALARVGVVPEEPDAPPHLSPRALAALCAALYPRWRAETVARRLDRFTVPVDTPFAQLSKGQKGHTLLALALGHEPDLLVLDDPTLGLDAVARRAVFDELIGELAERGTTVFIASHDLGGVERIAERVGILHRGRLVVDEALDDLKARVRGVRGPRDLDPAELAPHGVLARHAGSFGQQVVVERFDPRRFARQQVDLGLVADPLSLEEIFLAFAGEEAS